jgi:hypothetical protein
MVVLIIEQDYILSREHESQSPIAGDLDGPVVGKVGFQWMQVVSRTIRIIRGLSIIQHEKALTKFIRMFRPDTRLAACPVKLLQPFMLEALNHALLYLVTIHESIKTDKSRAKIKSRLSLRMRFILLVPLKLEPIFLTNDKKLLKLNIPGIKFIAGLDGKLL